MSTPKIEHTCRKCGAPARVLDNRVTVIHTSTCPIGRHLATRGPAK